MKFPGVSRFFPVKRNSQVFPGPVDTLFVCLGTKNKQKKIPPICLSVCTSLPGTQ